MLIIINNGNTQKCFLLEVLLLLLLLSLLLLLFIGQTDKLEFQAETRKLLDIVARSLYSEKEVKTIC